MTPQTTLRSLLQTLVLVVPFLVTGCVTVELPKHMVSDTIGAGKDLVHAIAGASELRFGNSTVGDKGIDVDELKKSCVDELVFKTQVQMQVDKLDYKVVGEQVGNRDSKVIVSCQIAVKS